MAASAAAGTRVVPRAYIRRNSTARVDATFVDGSRENRKKK